MTALEEAALHWVSRVVQRLHPEEPQPDQLAQALLESIAGTDWRVDDLVRHLERYGARKTARAVWRR